MEWSFEDRHLGIGGIFKALKIKRSVTFRRKIASEGRMPVEKPTLFLTTRWTLVGKAVGNGGTEARKARDDLFLYWKPLYRYVRRTNKSRGDAEAIFHRSFHQGARMTLSSASGGTFRV